MPTLASRFAIAAIGASLTLLLAACGSSSGSPSTPQPSRLAAVQKAQDKVLNLLAVEFDQSDPPGGCITLIFSDDIMLKLEVECLEAELADLGEAWAAGARPVHLDQEPGRA